MPSHTSPQRKKVLITVKTYPTLSSKYDELVCTAGVTEDGEWIRLYPIPFRQLEKNIKYKKYQWIELDVIKNTSDPRPESFRPFDIDKVEITGSMDTGSNKKWEARKDLILKNVYTNLTTLIDDNKNKEEIGISLAVFKPTKILDFTITECEREWDPKKLKAIEERAKQIDLFGEKDGNPFKVANKLPYEFRYVFEDEDGRESSLMIEDWEIGQLYWNCLKRSRGDESIACQQVKQKYFDKFIKKDLHFFLGTIKESDIRKFNNPFVVIGVFYPPKIDQEPLF